MSSWAVTRALELTMRSCKSLPQQAVYNQNKIVCEKQTIVSKQISDVQNFISLRWDIICHNLVISISLSQSCMFPQIPIMQMFLISLPMIGFEVITYPNLWGFNNIVRLCILFSDINGKWQRRLDHMVFRMDIYHSSDKCNVNPSELQTIIMDKRHRSLF